MVNCKSKRQPTSQPLETSLFRPPASPSPYLDHTNRQTYLTTVIVLWQIPFRISPEEHSRICRESSKGRQNPRNSIVRQPYRAFISTSLTFRAIYHQLQQQYISGLLAETTALRSKNPCTEVARTWLPRCPGQVRKMHDRAFVTRGFLSSTVPVLKPCCRRGSTVTLYSPSLQFRSALLPQDVMHRTDVFLGCCPRQVWPAVLMAIFARQFWGILVLFRNIGRAGVE